MELGWRIFFLSVVFGAPVSMSDPSDPSYWRREAAKKIDSMGNEIFNNNGLAAKNVILFIGDGMGLATITAARILKAQISSSIESAAANERPPTRNYPEEGSLTFETFESLALAKTYILDSQVGDSGACATALMSGAKTNFETVGVSGRVKLNDCAAVVRDPAVRVSSLADWAQQQGKATGFVTTTRVTHATPAAMYAHSASRYWESDDRMQRLAESVDGYSCKDIARQLMEDEPGRNLNVILGGGKRNLLPSSVPGGKRQDDRNLIDAWIRDKQDRNLHARFVSNRRNLLQLRTEKVDYLLGVFSDNHMAHETDRDRSDQGEPSLAEMTGKAIEVLRHNPNGFFLMVESGRIDHAHHLNNAYRALTDTLALDDAVATAMATVNRSNTLMVVTADHSHVFTFGGFPQRGNSVLGVDNQVSDVDHLPYTTLLYANGPGYRRENITNVDTEHRDYIQQAAVPKRWETHGGEDVPVYVTGPGSRLFSGVIDQTFVPFAISYAMCSGPIRDLCLEHKRRSMINTRTGTGSSTYRRWWATSGGRKIFTMSLSVLTVLPVILAVV